MDRGRADKHGRTTRASRSIKRPAGKPLPFHLQVLPQRLDPTPVHPHCATTSTHWGRYVVMSKWHWTRFVDGRGLWPRKVGKYRVELFGQSFHHDDALYALAWVRAAQEVTGLDVRLYTTD